MDSINVNIETIRPTLLTLFLSVLSSTGNIATIMAPTIGIITNPTIESVIFRLSSLLNKALLGIQSIV